MSESVFAAKHAGRPIPARRFELNVGETYREPPEIVRAELERLVATPRTFTYAPPQGEAPLLDAIQRSLGQHDRTKVARDCIAVVPGATSGFSIVCQTVLDPGDEVIILAPYWPLIRGIVSSRGAVPVEVPFFDRLGLRDFDPEAAIAAAITPRTAAIYVNSPNNPTGRLVTNDVQRVLARLSRRYDLWVLDDEVYEHLVYGEASPPPWTHSELGDRSVVVHSLSKTYALPGARVGYVHGPAPLMARLRGVNVFQSYCAARPMQLMAARLLDEGEAWLAETRRLYARAASEAAITLGLAPPSAGTFLFFDVAAYLRSGEGLDDFLQRCFDAGVLLTPGRASGEAYGSWVRLCFTAVAPADLAEALRRLGDVLGRAAASATPA